MCKEKLHLQLLVVKHTLNRNDLIIRINKKNITKTYQWVIILLYSLRQIITKITKIFPITPERDMSNIAALSIHLPISLTLFSLINSSQLPSADVANGGEVELIASMAEIQKSLANVINFILRIWKRK